MLPLLFHLGPFPVYTYGVLVALGFLAGLFLNRILAARHGIDPERMVDFNFWAMVASAIGARLIFVLTQWEHFRAHPVEVFELWRGGLVFWGAPIGILLLSLWYLPKRQLPFWKTLDITVCGLVLGHIFGRLGCLGAGCCYGSPTSLPWGIPLSTSGTALPLHPVQLYEAFTLCVLLGGLLYVLKRRRFDGQVLLTYAMAYPVLRSFLEEFRGDSVRGFVLGGMLSTSQFISVLVFLAAVVALFFRLKATAVSPTPLKTGGTAS